MHTRARAAADQRNCSNILKRNSIDVRSISSDRLRHVLARVQTKKGDKVFIMMHLKKDFFIRTEEARASLFLSSARATNPFPYLFHFFSKLPLIFIRLRISNHRNEPRFNLLAKTSSTAYIQGVYTALIGS